MTFDPDEHLHNLIFGNLSQSEFSSRYEDEVGNLSEEVVVEVFSGILLPKLGKCNATLYRGGLVVLVSGRNKWSLYRTRESSEWSEHIARWSEYMRGNWTTTVPVLPGFYAVRNKEHRLSFHEFREVGGRLLDMNSGLVPAGKSSNWLGEYWSLPLPSYPGAV